MGRLEGVRRQPGTASTANKHVRYLNINKKITAVTAGRLGGGASEFGTRDCAVRRHRNRRAGVRRA